jgi:Fe-S cluster assembly protein SufD
MLVICLNVPGSEPAEHHGGLQYAVPAGTVARVFEVHVSFEAVVPTFSTHVSRLAIGDGARVEHIVWQQLGPKSHHVAITQAELGRDARLTCHGFTDGGALTRNEVRVRFAAPGGEADLHGLMLGRGTDLVDYHTLVEHATTDSASRQTYKGILADRAKAVFEGQVRIRPGAQRTNATQSVKHLLLSDGALAHAKPVLEILADDVKCAHGAAIGQLDEAALFYLRSRGVPFADARRLLVEAVADDLIGRVGDASVREWLGPRVRAALPLEPA